MALWKLSTGFPGDWNLNFRRRKSKRAQSNCTKKCQRFSQKIVGKLEIEIRNWFLKCWAIKCIMYIIIRCFGINLLLKHMPNWVGVSSVSKIFIFLNKSKPLNPYNNISFNKSYKQLCSLSTHSNLNRFKSILLNISHTNLRTQGIVHSWKSQLARPETQFEKLSHHRGTGLMMEGGIPLSIMLTPSVPHQSYLGAPFSGPFGPSASSPRHSSKASWRTRDARFDSVAPNAADEKDSTVGRWWSGGPEKDHPSSGKYWHSRKLNYCVIMTKGRSIL